MTHKEFSIFVSEAKKGAIYQTEEEINNALLPFCGCALHRDRFLCTREQLITWVRWQCMQFNGEWDYPELEVCGYIAKRIDLI
jgi:hypothetical protein